MKRVRADSLRNRAHVLAVAQEVFASEGLAVPIDEIARRAKLGVGTVYRHFPTKEALFAAIVHERMASSVAHAKSLVRATDPGAAFFAFLERLWLEGARKRDLVDALGADWKASSTAPRAELAKLLGTLLRRAQTAGAVRAGLKAEDVLALMSATFSASLRPGVAADAVFAVIRDGLRG